MKKVLKFYSDTCGPCKVMKKELMGLKNADLQELNINDEANDPLMAKYDIRSIPTILVLGKEDTVIGRFVGVTPITKIQKIVDAE